MSTKPPKKNTTDKLFLTGFSYPNLARDGGSTSLNFVMSLQDKLWDNSLRASSSAMYTDLSTQIQREVITHAVDYD